MIEQLLETITGNRIQYLVYLGISVMVLVFVGILYFYDKLIFQRFLGKTNPLVAFSFSIILGFIILTIFLNKGWFAIYIPDNLKGIVISSILASILGIIMISVDIKSTFPADINILFPESILFYPAIGFFVEVIFHLLPLAFLLLIFNSIFNSENFETIVLICIILVSIIEPLYQSISMYASNKHPLWVVIYVGIHIFLISFIQLMIFRKYDFVSMYYFRLVYYLFWHIGWGYARLQILF